MNTFSTTLNLPLAGRIRPVEIHADYTWFPHKGAICVSGGDIVGPAEPAYVEIHHVRAVIRGKTVGFADRLTDEDWELLEQKIMDSLEGIL